MCLSIKRIGIVGAGISGLTMAYNINKIAASRHQSIYVDILQAEQKPGGRIKSSSVNQKMKKSFHFDLGANLIDFQTAESRKIWQQLIPADVTQKLMLFQKPFLIYDYDSKAFRKGDYQKQRFYYKDGFQNFVNNIISHLDKKQTNINYNCKVVNLSEDNGKVKLIFQNKFSTQHQERIYDYVFLSCPPPQILEIITNKNKYAKKEEGTISEQIQEIIKFCKASEYTKQISVGFFANQIIEDFSCVLFKSHPIITFICSNQEKYNDSSFVVQTTQKFTETYSKKNIDLYKQQILDNVYDSLPESVKKLTIKEEGIIHFWGVSLYKGSQTERFMEKNRLIHVIGDSRMEKSRVSGAIVSVMQHLPKL